jgi:hypothetical protein
MRFNCGLTREEKDQLLFEKRAARREAKFQWHGAFAWLPVRIKPRVCIWLEFYERRMVDKMSPSPYGDCFDIEHEWEYREDQTTPWSPL